MTVSLVDLLLGESGDVSAQSHKRYIATVVPNIAVRSDDYFNPMTHVAFI